MSDHWGCLLPKCGLSRVRRRERRAAERDTVAADEKVTAEKAAAEANPGKTIVEELEGYWESTTEKVAAGKVSAENVAAEKVAAEKVNAKKDCC